MRDQGIFLIRDQNLTCFIGSNIFFLISDQNFSKKTCHDRVNLVSFIYLVTFSLAIFISDRFVCFSCAYSLILFQHVS